MKRFTFLPALFVCAMAPASAQLLTASFGGGSTVPVYNTGQRFDNGWNVGAGVGIRPIPYMGAMLDFGYFQMDARRNSQLRVYSFTIDPVIHLNPRGPVGMYLIGGAGVYHVTEDLAFPAIGGTTVKGGANGGAGFEIGFAEHVKAFAEARYHSIYTQGRNTTFIPVTVGFRW